MRWISFHSITVNITLDKILCYRKNRSVKFASLGEGDFSGMQTGLIFFCFWHSKSRELFTKRKQFYFVLFTIFFVFGLHKLINRNLRLDALIRQRSIAWLSQQTEQLYLDKWFVKPDPTFVMASLAIRADVVLLAIINEHFVAWQLHRRRNRLRLNANL